MNSECFVPLSVGLRLRSLRCWLQSGITLPLAEDDMQIERKEKRIGQCIQGWLEVC